MILGGIIQTVIAIALVILLCVIAFLVYNAEMLSTLRESTKIRRATPIFEGVKDLQVSKNDEYNTVDPTHPLYRRIDNSLNQKAGAEYTYNFWLFVASGQNWGTASTNMVYNTDTGLTKRSTQKVQNDEKPLVLFLRGSKIAVPYKSICKNRYKIDVMLKQPLVKLERNGDVMVIELNTQNHPDAIKEKSRDTCSENSINWESVNSYRLAIKGFTSTNSDMAGKWNMVTLIVQDTFPSDPLPLRNKVRVRLYVNSVMEMDRYVDGKLADITGTSSTIRMNSANLHVAPIITLHDGTTQLSHEITGASNTNKVMLADLTYFNYAIDDVERRELFKKGFKEEYATSVEVNPASVTYGSSTNGFNTTKNLESSEPMLNELGA